MLKAPGNIVSGIASGTMNFLRYTVYGAAVCGLAVMLNQFASNAFGMENWAGKAVDAAVDTVSPFVVNTFNWLTNLVGIPAADPNVIKNFVGGVSDLPISARNVTGTGAIGTIQGWANGIAETVGGWIGVFSGGNPANVLAANTKVANAVLAAGGTAAVVGTTVGKWQAMEDQRRASRAQALQQLG